MTIPYGRQDISPNDIEAVCKVLRSDRLTQGPAVPSFEGAVSAYCGARYGIATNSATSALHIACLALDLGPDDWLWTSPITFVASANCALYCGARVDFVDIDADTCNMSPQRLAEKLAVAKRQGRLPKIVVPVHLCGQSCDMESIRDLSDEYGFRVIEDASHALGARYKGEPVGSCRHSDITVFSFHPVKIITTGEGGLATTNDPTLAERMQDFRSHGITGDRRRMRARSQDEIWNYQQVRLGYNYRMSDLQAALGESQMSRLDDFVAARHGIAARYDEALAGIPITRPFRHSDTQSSYHLYPIRVRQEECGRTQQDLYVSLLDEGVQANLHYIPVYRQPYYEDMGFSAGYCPDAEKYYTEAITLPVYPTLTQNDQDKVINIIRRNLGVF